MKTLMLMLTLVSSSSHAGILEALGLNRFNSPAEIRRDGGDCDG